MCQKIVYVVLRVEVEQVGTAAAPLAEAASHLCLWCAAAEETVEARRCGRLRKALGP
jgi:hypothetical protein